MRARWIAGFAALAVTMVGCVIVTSSTDGYGPPVVTPPVACSPGSLSAYDAGVLPPCLCSGPADCTDGGTCCLAFQSILTTTVDLLYACESTCPETLGNLTRPACHTDSDCTNGQPCVSTLCTSLNANFVFQTCGVFPCPASPAAH